MSISASFVQTNDLHLPSIGQYNGSPVTIAGWGLTSADGPSSPVLLAANVQVTSTSYCQQNLPNNQISQNKQICTTGLGQKDACALDSGSATAWYNSGTMRYVAIGIVSYGQLCGTNKPAVNTRVNYYMNWVRNALTSRSYNNEIFCAYN